MAEPVLWTVSCIVPSPPRPIWIDTLTAPPSGVWRGALTEGFDPGADQGRQVDLAALEGELTGLHLREEQQVVDQAAHPGGLLVDDPASLGHLGLRSQGAVVQRL